MGLSSNADEVAIAFAPVANAVGAQLPLALIQQLPLDAEVGRAAPTREHVAKAVWNQSAQRDAAGTEFLAAQQQDLKRLADLGFVDSPGSVR
jgi:hypothetical protein